MVCDCVEADHFNIWYYNQEMAQQSIAVTVHEKK